MDAVPNNTDDAVPALYRDADTAARIALIADSHVRLLGSELVAPCGDMVAALWNAPFALVAHGVDDDPVFFFGNRAALGAFECGVDAFLAMPSRLSAEAALRSERQNLLDRVSRDGFIDDYAGIRISATGRRFLIEGATVWNIISESGLRVGQAARFAV